MNVRSAKILLNAKAQLKGWMAQRLFSIPMVVEIVEQNYTLSSYFMDF